MRDVSIDDVVIGVKAVDVDGNQSLVSAYREVELPLRSRPPQPSRHLAQPEVVPKHKDLRREGACPRGSPSSRDLENPILRVDPAQESDSCVKAPCNSLAIRGTVGSARYSLQPPPFRASGLMG